MPACYLGVYRSGRASEKVGVMFKRQARPANTSSAALGHRVIAIRATAPGLVACLIAAGISLAVSLLLPGVSALLVAIVLGVLLANAVRIPDSWSPGLAVSAKKLLRTGIVLLGLQLVLGDILGLGWGMIVGVVAIVVVGIFGTVALGKILKVPSRLTLLIACGFSICGAAAVAATASVIEPTDPQERRQAEEDTITAVALVVMFGTAMIALVPLISAWLDLPSTDAGLWAGGSIHEVAQVVAAGSILGGGALAVAAVVKLTRVLMLAPVIAVLSARARKRVGVSATKRPPLVPLFVVGFLAMVVLRSLVDVPQGALTAASVMQTILLSAAMFALGCGVKVRQLAKVGAKPFLLATLSTILVAGVAGIAVVLH